MWNSLSPGRLEDHAFRFMFRVRSSLSSCSSMQYFSPLERREGPDVRQRPQADAFAGDFHPCLRPQTSAARRTRRH